MKINGFNKLIENSTKIVNCNENFKLQWYKNETKIAYLTRQSNNFHFIFEWTLSSNCLGDQRVKLNVVSTKN